MGLPKNAVAVDRARAFLRRLSVGLSLNQPRLLTRERHRLSNSTRFGAQWLWWNPAAYKIRIISGKERKGGVVGVPKHPKVPNLGRLWRIHERAEPDSSGTNGRDRWELKKSCYFFCSRVRSGNHIRLMPIKKLVYSCGFFWPSSCNKLLFTYSSLYNEREWMLLARL